MMHHQKSHVPVYLFIALMISLSVIFRASNDKPVTASAVSPQNTPASYFSKIEAVKLPENVSFANEPVPMGSFDVVERLDRELLVNTYWHSNTLQLFKLASRHFPQIEKILKEEGVPDDFKYLALAESGLRNVISPSNAAGFWQFLESAGKENGLEINNVVDERYNVEMSTRAACKYLKKSHEEFGSWTLAAASYNMGKSRLKKTINEQKVGSYYDLFMNDETSRYVFRILALKEIISNPKHYGFYLDRKDFYEPLQTRVVNVNENIENLADFALDNGTNYKTLKLLNPWLRQPYLHVKKGKSYAVRLPA